MKQSVFLVVSALVLGAMPVAADSGVEARLAALEKRVAELERRLEGARQGETADSGRNQAQGLREKVKARMDKDVAEYGQEAMRDIERLYRAYSRSRQTGDLEELVKRYPKANRTGCAVMYAGQGSKGEEAVKWLKKAIDDHADCRYGDGAVVGAYARFYLASIYEQQGKKDEARKLKEEILTLYPDAVTHRGQPMKDLLGK